MKNYQMTEAQEVAAARATSIVAALEQDNDDTVSAWDEMVMALSANSQEKIDGMGWLKGVMEQSRWVSETEELFSI